MKLYKISIRVPYGKFALWGFVLMPLDSFYGLSGVVYRPLWIIPFVIIGLHSVFVTYKVDVTSLKLYLVLSYSFLVSFFSYIYFSYSDQVFLVKSVFIWLILFFGVLGLLKYFSLFARKVGVDVMIKGVSLLILISGVLPLCVGLVQVGLNLAGLNEVNVVLTSLFSYRVDEGRVQLISGEPSWAARYLLFLLAFSFVFRGGWLYAYRVVVVCLIYFTGSFLGYLSFLAIVAICLFQSGLRIRIFLKWVPLGVGVFLIGGFGIGEYTIKRASEIIELLSAMSLDNIFELAAVSASWMGRVINPFVAVELGFTHPLGIGFGAFKFWLPGVLRDYGVDYLYNDDYLLGAASTPKSLLPMIWAEYGILVFAILLIYYIKLVLAIKNHFVKYLLYCVPVFTLLFDSVLYYGLLVPLCMASIVARASPKYVGGGVGGVNNQVQHP
ncbi:hypothetical protein [Tepidimonas sediminis]|uniref:hypothetical protein n=1 Tax=Tepidimonas sediminis TaxID=2588941 RepID=UPI0011813324|nr:hypothetical protein [Tepidimonas sediminis]